MLRPALPTQTASPWPTHLSSESATRIGRSGPNPRTLLLALCAGLALLLLVAAGGVLPAATRAGAPVAQTSSISATVVETARSGRSRLSTAYDGPASCAEPGFLTGDTVGDANPAAMYRTLCGSASANR